MCCVFLLLVSTPLPLPPPLLLLPSRYPSHLHLHLHLQGNATVMSNGLLSAIKAAGGDGKIEVSELKNLLGLVGLRSN